MGGDEWRRTGVAPVGCGIRPADGGWAWVVLAGAYISGIVVVVPLITFSVTMNDVMTNFQVTTVTYSWALALLNTMGGLFAPVASVLVSVWSARKCVMLGGFLTFLAMIVSSMATNVYIIIAAYAVCGGLGNAFLYLPITAVLSSYFRVHLGVVNGFYFSSFSMGKLVLAPLADFLLWTYGWRGCMLLMGGIALHACAAAATFQPAKWHWQLVTVDNLLEQSHPMVRQRLGLKSKLKRALDVGLLKKPTFYLMGVTYCLLLTSAMCSSGYMFPFGVEAGLRPSQAAWMVSVHSIGELLGRMSGVYFISVFHLPLIPTFVIFCAAAAFAYTALTQLSSVVFLYLTAGVNGFFFGSAVGMFQSLNVLTMGVGRLVTTTSLAIFFQGFAMLTVGPCIGFLRDATGTYISTFLLFASMVATVTVMWTARWLHLACTARQR